MLPILILGGLFVAWIALGQPTATPRGVPLPPVPLPPGVNPINFGPGHPGVVPGPPPPAPPGVVPTQIDAAGAILVIVTPGDMGTLTMQSSASSPIGSGADQALDIQTPPGGALLNVDSTNQNVLFGMAGSSSTNGIALGSAMLPGSTRLTVSWRDASSRSQITTFTLVAT